MRIGIILITMSMLLVSCSSRDSTAQLADLFTDELEKLPIVISKVEDRQTAAIAVKKIQQIRKAIEAIIQQVEAEQYLTFEQRLIIEKKVRAVNEETSFLLQKLSNQPQVIADLSQPLIDLGRAIELASKVMKKE